MPTELKLPDVGDNIEKGNVVAVLIKPGDTISEGQPIIELETDKAVVEVPASAGGTVESVNVNVGDSVQIGGVLATLSGASPSVPAAQGGEEKNTQGGGDQAATVESSPTAANADTANRVAAAQQQNQVEQAAPVTPSAPAGHLPPQGGEAKSVVTLPDVGDNIEKGTVVAVLVNVGDTVSEGQAVIELETDKAVVEVPANASGTVQSIEAKVGDSLKVGATILTLSGGTGATQAAAPAAPATAPAAPSAPAAQPGEPKPPAAIHHQPSTFDGRPVIHAAPSVRRMAREMGVNLAQVQGSGPAGRISADDLKAAASGPAVAVSPSAPAPQAGEEKRPPAAAAQPLPDFTKWGQVRREEMSGIRRATVRSMTTAWTTIPMVTHFDKADVTLMEETRKRFGERVEKAGGKLTMTHILMKVVANALRKFPKFNASLDLAAEEVVYKDYVNIGVAVDTPVGLLVPVVKNADRMSITEMVLELSDLASRARERKLKPDEMQGATFTISNLGGIGGHAFTPIVNSPEVAILGVSRGGMEPVWNKEKGEFEPRNMLPLGLTYDHRLIDGADAARFVRFICESLEDPFLISL